MLHNLVARGRACAGVRKGDRMNLGMRMRAFLGLSAAAIAFGGPAAAQDAPPPPEQDTQSASGVSLVSGGYSTSVTDLRIGTGEWPQALVLERSYSSSLNKTHGLTDGLKGWGWATGTTMFISVGELGGGDFPPDEPLPDNDRYPWRYGIVEGTGTLASFVEQDPLSDPIVGPNYEGPFGQWNDYTPGTLQRVGNDLVFTAGDGARHIFEGGSRQTFRDNTPTFRTRLEAKDGTILTFHGTLGSQAVFSNRGMALLFELDTDGSSWKKACAVNLTVHQVTPTSLCPSGVPAVTYQQAAWDPAVGRKLTGVIDAAGNTTTYQYTADGQLDCIKLPGQASCQIRNYYSNCLPIPNQPTDYSMNSHQQVYRQDLITGESVLYDFDAQRYCPLRPPASGAYSAPYQDDVTMTFADGSTKLVTATYDGLPLKIRDALGRETTMIHGIDNLANRPTRLLEVRAPDGNKWLYEYSYGGLVTKTTVRSRTAGDPDLIWETSYGPCNQPVTQKDARGNITNLEYSSVHCGILKKTLPADSNGIRPQTRYGYVQKNAWIKNGSGFAMVAEPVWVLASEEFCRTSAADANGNCAAGAGDKVVTTYEYQNGNASKGSNVWLVGTAVTADGQTLRTCISYDQYGRPTSETSPRAGRASCQ